MDPEGNVVSGPDIVSRGFVYVRESEDLMDEAHVVAEETINDCLNNQMSDWGKIKNSVRDALSSFVWHKTKRRPMVLPIIMEA